MFAVVSPLVRVPLLPRLGILFPICTAFLLVLGDSIPLFIEGNLVFSSAYFGMVVALSVALVIEPFEE